MTNEQVTVEELIGILQRFDEDTLVMTDGYEGDYRDINADPEVKDVRLYQNNHKYDGDHAVVRHHDFGKGEVVKAIVL